MPTDLKKKLWEAAVKVREKSYAPYSKFKVGAAILDDQDRIFTGGNYENACYGAGICAERSAVAVMVSAGSTAIKQIAVVTDLPDGCAPCGICRQVLSEFSKDLKKTVVIVGNLTKITNEFTLEDLLPEAFTKKDLD